MLRLVLIATFLVAAYGKVVPAWLPPAGGKIVGGEDAEIEDVPYQAGLLSVGYFICGGSIISETVVLTAAHCTTMSASSYQVFVGTNTIYKPEDNKGQIVGVRKVVIHPNYRFPDYDAAVLVLSSPLILGPIAKAVALPNQNQEIADDTSAVTSGWGALNEAGQGSQILQKVTIPIVNQKICETAYDNLVTPRMICAGLMGVGGKDACQGDSGGPLVADGILVGITSWGKGCARPDYPGVWTRVSAISNWITEQLL